MNRLGWRFVLSLGACIALAWGLAGCDESGGGVNTQTVRPDFAPPGRTTQVPTLDIRPAPAPQVAAPTPSSQLPSTAQGREYWFCFWNVENLFDDQYDRRTGLGDKEYDEWYPAQPQILQQKLGKLCDVILSINRGRGPDILAVCEVESVRAAQLLAASLNARLADPALHYRNVLMKENAVGRHIAPAILTRLDVVRDKTRALGSRMRIIEGHVVADGRRLIVIASHWTSRLNDGEAQRTKYADVIYGECNAIYHSDPSADVLVCGDFNDGPNDVSVAQHLRATGDAAALSQGPHVALFNLMANKDVRQFGTMYYKSWNIFDQIVVTPGMLDRRGWSCDTSSVRVINNLVQSKDPVGRPWNFGGPKETQPRGYSDHFPVIVRLLTYP
jgi:endonuclease/exonuclease/phosphatase family metal-dependent hydrolase